MLLIFTLLLASLPDARAAQAPPVPTRIFLVAGQSNSANHGWPRQSPSDRHVLNWDPQSLTWLPDADPQLGATGDGGSPWPAFGSKLAHDLRETIGLVTVGVGGTAASEWLPDTGVHYWRLRTAVNAFPKGAITAVLWHQGEADSSYGTPARDYARMIAAIMKRVNSDAGYTIPWFVASASYVNFKETGPQEIARMAEVHRGQELLWTSGLAYRGANTDDLIGPAWRHDGIHFNEIGLRTHGTRWAEAVESVFHPRRPLRGD